MFKLLVLLPNSSMQWALFFNDREKAYRAQNEIVNYGRESDLIFDDHGQRLVMPSGVGLISLFIDLEAVDQAQAAEALLHARTQAKVNMQAQHDPAMMLHKRGGLIA